MKKIILVALVVLVAAGVSTALLLRSTSSPAKLALESANSTGASPFTSTVAAPAPLSPCHRHRLHRRQDRTGPQPVSGATPGLYGGTGNQAVCNRNQMAGFLMANPAKAAAWVAAQNSDPTLRWSGGTSLTVAQIPQYLNELTPITLLTDTRVTNNGYVNGQPVPYQAVLQAGTAVFVDQYGVPRVRCACGNPLLRSIALTSGYVPAGTPWHGYGHSVTIIQSATVITNLTLVNVNVNVNDNNNTRRHSSSRLAVATFQFRLPRRRRLPLRRRYQRLQLQLRHLRLPPQRQPLQRRRRHQPLQRRRRHQPLQLRRRRQLRHLPIRRRRPYSVPTVSVAPAPVRLT